MKRSVVVVFAAIVVAEALSGGGARAQSRAPAEIQAMCAKEWPDDFQMRAFCEKQQVDAAGKLNDRAMRSSDEQTIRRKCEAEWSDDYRMRDFCEQQQIEALTHLSPVPSETTIPTGPPPYLDSLINKSAAEVRAALGSPAEIAGARWAYDTTYKDSVKVYFNEDGRVREVAPKTARVSFAFIMSSHDTSVVDINPPKPEAVPPPDPAHTGAVAKCKNGGFALVDVGKNTCSKSGGVAEWYVPHK